MGLRLALKRLSGVKTVKWDAKHAIFNMTWDPKQPFDYQAARNQVRHKGGFTLKTATLTVVGTVGVQDGAATLTVPESGQVFRLAPGPKGKAAYEGLLSRPKARVQIVGALDTKRLKKKGRKRVKKGAVKGVAPPVLLMDSVQDVK